MAEIASDVALLKKPPYSNLTVLHTFSITDMREIGCSEVYLSV